MRFSITLTIEVENRLNLLTRLSWSRRKKRIKERDGEICRYCGRYTPDGHVDHIIPLSRGGNDDLDNLAWACPDCNGSKGDKTLAEWEDRPLPSPILPEPESEQIDDFIEDDIEIDDKTEGIKELAAQGVSKRQICLDVFGYTGGAAFDAVSRIVEDLENEALIEKVQKLHGEGVGLSAICDSVFGYHNSAKTAIVKDILGFS
jgi:hypothetical protein